MIWLLVDWEQRKNVLEPKITGRNLVPLSDSVSSYAGFLEAVLVLKHVRMMSITRAYKIYLNYLFSFHYWKPALTKLIGEMVQAFVFYKGVMVSNVPDSMINKCLLLWYPRLITVLTKSDH
jgi:hypothetical protein